MMAGAAQLNCDRLGGGTMADGYGFWWRGVYWASLTTGGRADEGQHDIYFGPVGADTHGHPWVQISSAGVIMGAQLKDQGAHVGSGVALQSFSTQPLLRGRAHWDPTRGDVVTQIANVLSPSVVSTVPVASSRTRSGRNPARIDVAVPSDASWFEFELALTRDRDCAAPSAQGSETLLSFADDSGLGVVFSVIACDR